MYDFRPFKNRTIELGQVVEVYRNLHNGLISIRDAKSKHVLGHCSAIALEDVTFKVSQSGRERVLREKRKNVHAVVKGRYMRLLKPFNNIQLAKYNPYKYETFVNEKTGQPVYESKMVQVHATGGIIYTNGTD